MAFWDKISSRGHVEDRRGAGGLLALGGGGLGVGGLVLILFLNYLGGGDITDILGQLEGAHIPAQSLNSQQFEGADQYEVFASTVLGSTNDMWSQTLSASGRQYPPPRLVLFRGATQSACGFASAQFGPHYCPPDRTIYLDETFFDELRSRMGARGGDVAEAYVIAHEAGHHAQNVLGIMDEVQSEQEKNPDRANELSIKQELQADCFAGLWAYSVKDLGVFENNEIIEAIDAAEAVGDDRIQKQTTGRVNPETWTHGSSQQRVEWFQRGYQSGQISACDTFR